jgi:hypothetical protein
MWAVVRCRMRVAVLDSVVGRQLPIDEALRAQFGAAVEHGRSIGLHIAGSSTRPNLATSRMLAIEAVRPLLPDAAQAQADLAFSRQIAARHTPEGIATANWLSDHAETEMIRNGLADYARYAGPEQAQVAVRHLEQVMTLARDLSRAAKRTYYRDRPFRVDPSLPVVVSPPKDDNLSFPSGHTTTAFAAAAVLGTLLPARRAEFLETATQIAFSRVYGGVHFGSDVRAGAALGNAAAAAGLAWLRVGVPLPPGRFDTPQRAAA